MAYTHSYGFGRRYQAPRSGAFGGTLGPKPKSTTKPLVGSSAAASAPPGGGSTPSGTPVGFTVQASTLPPDPAYQQTIGGLGQTRDNTIAGLQSQRAQGLAAYGYTEDPTTGALAFDPNDPYSQAALALKSYNQAKTGNTNSYAASGQLYAGSLQNAQNGAADSYGAANNHILGALTSFLTGNTTAQNSANDAYSTGAGTALGQSVANAPNNPLYQPASAANAGGATTSYNAATGEYALTGGAGGSALVPQSANSTVKLASGWSIVYDASGKPVRFIPPGG